MPRHHSMQPTCFEMHTSLIPLLRQAIRQAQMAKYKPNISRKSHMEKEKKKKKKEKKKELKVTSRFNYRRLFSPSPQKIVKMINFKLKEFLRKHSFPGLHLLPHLQQLWDSFLLHFSLLHWLFPGQGTQLTELNFIPLQVPTEYKLKWPLCKNVKSKRRFCDNLQCPNSETTWLKKGRGNQTKNTPEPLGIFTRLFSAQSKTLQLHSCPLPTKPNFAKSILQRPKTRMHVQKSKKDQEFVFSWLYSFLPLTRHFSDPKSEMN